MWKSRGLREPRAPRRAGNPFLGSLVFPGCNGHAYRKASCRSYAHRVECLVKSVLEEVETGCVGSWRAKESQIAYGPLHRRYVHIQQLLIHMSLLPTCVLAWKIKVLCQRPFEIILLMRSKTLTQSRYAKNGMAVLIGLDSTAAKQSHHTSSSSSLV